MIDEIQSKLILFRCGGGSITVLARSRPVLLQLSPAHKSRPYALPRLEALRDTMVTDFLLKYGSV